MMSSEVIKHATIISPELSIIIPVYNSGLWIRETLHSVLNQPGICFEVVLMDDGSVDNSLDVILDVADTRCTVVRSKTNRGVAPVRNEALSYARAEWICPFDADDLMLENRLCPYFEWMLRQDGAVWGNCGVLIADADGTPCNHAMGQPFDEVGMLGANTVNHGMSLIRKDALMETGGYEDTVTRGIDYTMMLKMTLLSPAFFYNEIGFLYRMHEKSISHVNDYPMKQIRKNYRSWLRKMRNKDESRGIRASLLLQILDLHDSIENKCWGKAADIGDSLLNAGVDTFELNKLAIIGNLQSGRFERAKKLLQDRLSRQVCEPVKGPAAHRVFVEKVWLVDQALRYVLVTGDTALKEQAVSLARKLLRTRPVPQLAALLKRLD